MKKISIFFFFLLIISFIVLLLDKSNFKDSLKSTYSASESLSINAESSVEERIKVNEIDFKLSRETKKLNQLSINDRIDNADNIKKAFEDNDICKIVTILKNNKDGHGELPTLINYLSQNPENAELSKVLNLYFHNTKSNINNEKEMAFYAYSIMGKDKIKSNSIFKQLQVLSPGNGAYYYFNLVNLEKSYLLKEVELLSRSKYFDSHFMWLTRSLHNSTLDNFNAFFLAKSVHSKIKYPDYLSPYKILKKYRNQIVERRDLSLFFDKQLKNQLSIKNKFMDINWIPIEYIIFKKIFYLLGNLENKKYIKYNEVIEKSSIATRRATRSKFVNGLNSDCDPKVAERFLEFEKELYNQFNENFELR